MYYEAREFMLKNRRKVVIRSADPEDAGEVLDLMYQVAGETDYLSRYPEERLVDIEGEKIFLQGTLQNDRDLMLCAFAEGSLVGTANIALILPRIRYQHRCGVGISIIRKYWRMGLGGTMMGILEEQAIASGFEQLELEVVASNRRAVALYEQRNYIVYGRRPHSFKYKDGSYADILLMMKYI